MSGLESFVLVFQLGLPLALVGWVGLARKRRRSSWALDITIAVSYLALIALGGLWMALPRLFAWAYAILLAAAVAFGARRLVGGGGAVRPALDRVGLTVRGVALLGSAGLVLFALWGWRGFEAEPLDLAFPLRDGTYLVVNGGSTLLLNFHLATLNRERARPYRGQSYAVDVVKLGRWGSRAAGVFPTDPAAFAIFGDAVHAPCPGRVVAAVDGHPDRLPPGAEPEALAGNHVILECGRAWIVLGHLQRSSVLVRAGKTVAVGDVLGRAGNSGRSDEPHLHIHAQTPGTDEAPLGGSPIPLTFGGRHLVRNDRVRGILPQELAGRSRAPASITAGLTTEPSLRMARAVHPLGI